MRIKVITKYVRKIRVRDRSKIMRISRIGNFRTSSINRGVKKFRVDKIKSQVITKIICVLFRDISKKYSVSFSIIRFKNR